MRPNSPSIQIAEICGDTIQRREGEVKWETLDIAGVRINLSSTYKTVWHYIIWAWKYLCPLILKFCPGNLTKENDPNI